MRAKAPSDQPTTDAPAPTAAPPPATSAPPGPPPPPKPLDRLALYYDGRRGALQVTLRDKERVLKLEGPALRLVPTADAMDLLAPAIGGGAFHRAIALTDAGSWRPADLEPTLAALAKSGEITVTTYEPTGESYLVLDVKTRTRLQKAA